MGGPDFTAVEGPGFSLSGPVHKLMLTSGNKSFHFLQRGQNQTRNQNKDPFDKSGTVATFNHMIKNHNLQGSNYLLKSSIAKH